MNSVDAPTLEPPLKLECVEFHEYSKGGITRPLLVGAQDSDGKVLQVVLKVREPNCEYGKGHYGKTSLACELICAVVERALGLQVPDYAIVEIPRTLAANTKAESAREIFRRNVGTNFGSIYQEGLMEWSADDAIPSSFADTFEAILSFDAGIYNSDRRSSNPNLLLRNDSSALLIDHSLALPAHRWPEEKVSASPCFEDHEILRHCTYPTLRNGQKLYQALFDRWASVLGSSTIEQLKSLIPHHWESNPGELDRIFRFLRKRSNKFGDVSARLRRCVR